MLSCAKEVHNTDNPVCYKRACVFKVVATADDKGFQLEEVNVPLGVMRASSLQVSNINVHSVHILTCVHDYLQLASSLCESDVFWWMP